MKGIFFIIFLGMSLLTFSKEQDISKSKNNETKEWMGIPYPMKRWGVSILGVNQVESGNIKKVDMNFDKIEIQIPNLGVLESDLKIINPDSIEVDADVKLVKVDYFVLPFLSVYGIYGQVDAKVKMRAGNPGISNPKFVLDRVNTGKPIADSFQNGIIGKIESELNKNPEAIEGLVNKDLAQQITLNGDFNTEGDIYGIGALVAGEYKNIFAMFQYTYSEIKMKDGLAKKKAEMANGRLGYSFKPDGRYIRSFTPYIGAGYQLMDTQVKAGVGDLNVIIDLELDEISPAAGFFMQFPNDITLLVEGTWGTKDSIAIDVGYRF
ncbi:MAG: hypothetical protein ACRCZ9_12455 [Fusobacteriaceae bacterium]